jgi:hypothetical protein
MTRKRTQETFEVSHFRVRVTDCPSNGITFALIAGDKNLPERETKMFSGHVEVGMSSELHRLAAHVSGFEEKLRGNSQ